MSPTAAAFAPTSAPHSCPGAAAIPRGPTPAAGPKEQQQPPALPDFKLIQIPGEDDPSAFFFAPENLMYLKLYVLRWCLTHVFAVFRLEKISLCFQKTFVMCIKAFVFLEKHLKGY